MILKEVILMKKLQFKLVCYKIANTGLAIYLVKEANITISPFYTKKQEALNFFLDSLLDSIPEA